MTQISLIVAIDKNRGIGKGNQLLFDIPEDMKYFRKTTNGHAIIMGRKTFQSIGRPLPYRRNIVLTRDKSLNANGCEVVHSIEEALETVRREEKEVFIIGGAQVYDAFFPFANRLYLTVVDHIAEADAFFPKYDKVFSRVFSKRDSCDENYNYTFYILERANDDPTSFSKYN